MQKYRFVDLNNAHYDMLLVFMRKVHPRRKRIEAYIQHFIMDNPYRSSSMPALRGLLLLCDEEIVGSFLFLPFMAHTEGKEYAGAFGYDLIIDEQHRRRELGIKLFMSGLAKFECFAAIGSSPSAQKGYRAMKYIELPPGWLFTLYRTKLLHFLFTTKRVFRFTLLNKLRNRCRKLFLAMKYGNQSSALHKDRSFPDIISGGMFYKVERPDKLRIPNPLPDLLSFIRTKDFAEWAYFSDELPCTVYQRRDSNDYFVARLSYYNDLPCLMLMDYQVSDVQDIRDVVSSFKNLMTRMLIDSAISISSFKNSDEAFIASGFEKEPLRTISFQVNFGEHPGKICSDNREAAFFNIIDSDMSGCFGW